MTGAGLIFLIVLMLAGGYAAADRILDWAERRPYGPDAGDDTRQIDIVKRDVCPWPRAD